MIGRYKYKLTDRQITAPIKAMEGCVPWDLGVVLKSTRVDLTLAQLLNDSPKLRKQLGVG